MKILFILIGIILIFLGLFLTFGILVSSLKERDESGYYSLFLSLGIIGLGIYVLVKGIKSK